MNTKRQGALPTVLFAILLLLPLFLYAEDEPALPRLAVVEFTGNVPGDAATVRTIVESVMIDSGNYTIVSTYDIDQILKQQGIALSSISSQANITKLQRENIKYIVTGTVDREGAEAIVSLRMLDVSNARFFPNSPRGVVNMSSMRSRLKDISDISSAFLSGMTGSGEQVVRSDSAQARQNSTASVPANMVRVEGGTFSMGSSNGDSDEKPVHSVTVRSFSMGKYEVTQAEYEAVMGTNPSNWKGANLPVERVSWLDAIEYCNKLSIKEGLAPAYRGSGNDVVCNFFATGYRLPTEAEWEYAAKGGNKDYMTYEYAGGNNAGAVGWYDGNSGGQTHEVGTKVPNSLGLYDMSGNVWEWCWDWYTSGYSATAQTDPTGAASGSDRVRRGGSWFNDALCLRSAYRGYDTPSGRYTNYGFRVVRP
jgi:formylglycine-generating enzyme required for sulfatase activity